MPSLYIAQIDRSSKAKEARRLYRYGTLYIHGNDSVCAILSFPSQTILAREEKGSGTLQNLSYTISVILEKSGWAKQALGMFDQISLRSMAVCAWKLGVGGRYYT